MQLLPAYQSQGQTNEGAVLMPWTDSPQLSQRVWQGRAVLCVMLAITLMCCQHAAPQIDLLSHNAPTLCRRHITLTLCVFHTHEPERCQNTPIRHPANTTSTVEDSQVLVTGSDGGVMHAGASVFHQCEDGAAQVGHSCVAHLQTGLSHME